MSIDNTISFVDHYQVDSLVKVAISLTSDDKSLSDLLDEIRAREGSEVALEVESRVWQVAPHTQTTIQTSTGSRGWYLD